MPAEIPGTTSQAMPAATGASPSSPPRPRRKGSLPLSPATPRPPPPAPISRRLISACGSEWRPEGFPPLRISRPGPAHRGNRRVGPRCLAQSLVAAHLGGDVEEVAGLDLAGEGDGRESQLGQSGDEAAQRSEILRQSPLVKQQLADARASSREGGDERQVALAVVEQDQMAARQLDPEEGFEQIAGGERGFRGHRGT